MTTMPPATRPMINGTPVPDSHPVAQLLRSAMQGLVEARFKEKQTQKDWDETVLKWLAIANDDNAMDNVCVWKAMKWCPAGEDEGWDEKYSGRRDAYILMAVEFEGTYSATLSLDMHDVPLVARGPFPTVDAAVRWGIAAGDRHNNSTAPKTKLKRPATAWALILKPAI